MTPKYLRHEVDQSRANFGVETLDVYYVHNPETQMPEVGETEFYARSPPRSASWRSARRGQDPGLRRRDVARLPRAARPRIVPVAREDARLAEAAGGKNHRFRAIQFPFNFGLPEALTVQNQTVGEKTSGAIEAARDADSPFSRASRSCRASCSAGFGPDFKAKFPGSRPTPSGASSSSGRLPA
jgi:hypothetical protein